jgi:hypothetical protein
MTDGIWLTPRYAQMSGEADIRSRADGADRREAMVEDRDFTFVSRSASDVFWQRLCETGALGRLRDHHLPVARYRPLWSRSPTTKSVPVSSARSPDCPSFGTRT